jgi:Domain of unknown function (DUF4263)
VNLIVTGRENATTEVDELRKRHCAVDILPNERLLDILKQELAPLLMADAIVCFIDIDESEMGSPPTQGVESAAGQRFVREMRRLPDSSAMPDGRKWKAIPIVVVLSGAETYLSREIFGALAASEAVEFVEAAQDFDPTFRAIDGAVRNYRQRVLAMFSDLGFLVSYQDGRYRVGPAMNPSGSLEGFFYDARLDKRDLQGRFFTVDRDPSGIQYEADLFEALVNGPGTDEYQLQKFFVENPHFLADARLSQPLAHVRLEGQAGDLLIPDFVIKPIVAYQRDSNWEVLDLKKPSVRLLAGNSRHVRLSHEVTQAITQLRDYGDYFRNPENTQRVSHALGHPLRYPRLAVLIGRLRESNVEELEKAQSREPDVRIVTYDEILERQQQMAR